MGLDTRGGTHIIPSKLYDLNLLVRRNRMNPTHKSTEGTAKKVYVEPTLETVDKLQDVTEGIVPVVTGAEPA